MPHLNEDGEEDDGDDGGEEHLPLGKVLHLQQEAQREGDGAAQAAIRNDELVFGGQLDDAELVDKEGQADNTWGKKRRAELLPDSLHELLEYDETGFSSDFEKKDLVEAICTVSVNMPSCKFANPELVTV